MMPKLNLVLVMVEIAEIGYLVSVVTLDLWCGSVADAPSKLLTM